MIPGDYAGIPLEPSPPKVSAASESHEAGTADSVGKELLAVVADVD